MHKGPIRIEERDCLFCMKQGFKPIYKIDFAPLLNRALYTKYASKKYERKFEDLYQNRPLPWIIKFKDNLVLLNQEEYLKRLYPLRDQLEKFESLLEYYKYHKDIPRIYVGPISDTITYYYEKQKQIEYKKIKIQLGIPIEQTECTYREPLSKELRVLDSMSDLNSSRSLLKELLKQPSHVNLDDSWRTMAPPKPNIQLLKSLIAKQSQFSVYKKKELPSPQKPIGLSKQSSMHMQQSTRSISSEQLKLAHTLQGGPSKVIHKKSNTHYTEVSSPQKSLKSVKSSLQIKAVKYPTESTDKLFKIYKSQSPMNINININHVNVFKNTQTPKQKKMITSQSNYSQSKQLSEPIKMFIANIRKKKK